MDDTEELNFEDIVYTSLPQRYRPFKPPNKIAAERRINSNPLVNEDQLNRFMDRAMALDSPRSIPLGSFASCEARYDGRRSETKLRQFLLDIALHKDVEEINDDIALHELPLLLEGEASKWWEAKKANVYDWSEAIDLLKRAFWPKKQAYEIYTEVFDSKQGPYIASDVFIERKRNLLAELPQPPPENAQIDMIYSLMDITIKQKVPRYKISSLNHFIELVREADYERNWYTDELGSQYRYKVYKRRRDDAPRDLAAERYITEFRKRMRFLAPERDPYVYQSEDAKYFCQPDL